MMLVFRLGWLASVALIALAIGFSTAVGRPTMPGATRVAPMSARPASGAGAGCAALPTGDLAFCE
ncbi:hypothetical protein [Methylobacterium nodulans]|nr:hypothetical protein [Methylobacterium nodulans]